MISVLFICVLVFLLAAFIGITEWCMNRTDQARLDLEVRRLHERWDWQASELDDVWSERAS